MAFLLFVICIPLTIFTVIMSLQYLDVIIVFLLDCFKVTLFHNVSAIATLIIQCPNQWTVSSGGRTLIHPDIGAIWIGNEAYGIEIDTPSGKWKPNIIERRIIMNAVDLHIQHTIKLSIARAINREEQIRNSRIA